MLHVFAYNGTFFLPYVQIFYITLHSCLRNCHLIVKIRVSSEISNAPIILNVDCDMYSNNSDTIRDAMCFFMDEKQGHEISYVQFPQRYENITKNDIYANESSPVHKVGLILEQN